MKKTQDFELTPIVQMAQVPTIGNLFLHFDGMHIPPFGAGSVKSICDGNRIWFHSRPYAAANPTQVAITDPNVGLVLNGSQQMENTALLVYFNLSVARGSAKIRVFSNWFTREHDFTAEEDSRFGIIFKDARKIRVLHFVNQTGPGTADYLSYWSFKSITGNFFDDVNSVPTEDQQLTIVDANRCAQSFSKYETELPNHPEIELVDREQQQWHSDSSSSSPQSP